MFSSNIRYLFILHSFFLFYEHAISYVPLPTHILYITLILHLRVHTGLQCPWLMWWGQNFQFPVLWHSVTSKAVPGASKKCRSFTFTLEDVGATIFRKVLNNSTREAASHPWSTDTTALKLPRLELFQTYSHCHDLPTGLFNWVLQLRCYVRCCLPSCHQTYCFCYTGWYIMTSNACDTAIDFTVVRSVNWSVCTRCSCLKKKVEQTLSLL